MSIPNVWIYGDSLSTGTHGDKAYLQQLQAGLGIQKLSNFAVGSSGLTEHTPNSAVSIIRKQLEEGYKEEQDPDVILIWHGSNDWYWGSPLGSFDEPAEDTFCGSVRWTVKTLRETYPGAMLIWVTPIFRLEKPDGRTISGDAFETSNKQGLVLGDYVEALRKASVRYHIPLIEMGQYVNIHEANEVLYMEDHVHPNAHGYEKIARVLIKGIQEAWELQAETI